MQEPKTMFSRQLYRRFSAFDFVFRSFVRRIEKFFMRSEGTEFIRDMFEPAVSGVVMGLTLLVLDEFRQKVGAPPLFKHAIDSAVEHAKPYAFFLSVLFIGGYLVSVGSLLSTLVRRLVVLPLARLSAHATMFALGIFLVFAGLEMFQRPSISVVVLSTRATLAISALGACSRALVLFFESGLADRIGLRYQSARLFCFGAGVVLLGVAVFGLRELNAQDANEATAAAQKQSGAAPSGH